ncbi:MAG: HPr family phosphocarrier protein [Oscillospiraceae bacterium]|jgi:phosphocarrier protein HPr|nr:HPr family phosphocarrier protein [Oscillospiraceae bacterium]MDD3260403.1 HPr family phosphocarrier protein [Oscillospiraceae bacterium]
MKTVSYVITDAAGIHARPAGLLVKLAKSFSSKVTISSQGRSCDMKRLMALMSLGIQQGSPVQVTIEGEDEEACAQAVQKFLTEKL